MSATLADFLFETFNFLLLAAALGWVFFRPVRRALDAEQARHRSEREEVERLRAEVAAERESLARERDEATRAADRRRREAIEAAGAEADRLLEQARGEQSARRGAVERELEAMRAAEEIDAAEAVGRLAAESVRRLLETLDGPSLDLALARAACAELRKLPAAARTTARVESARPLEAAASEMLSEVLGGAPEPRVVPELGAGVRVSTSSGQVDATALAVARRAGRELRARAAPPPPERSGAQARDG